MVSSIRILVAISIAQAHLSLDQTDTVASELREFVRNVVDPAIKAIQANETNGPRTDCFGTSAGRLLRSRCCVYFSNVAGSLIEARYGSLRPPRSQPLDLSLGLPPPLDLTYQLTAKWLLAHVNDPLALGVGAERVANVEGFHQQVCKCTFFLASSFFFFNNLTSNLIFSCIGFAPSWTPWTLFCHRYYFWRFWDSRQVRDGHHPYVSCIPRG